MADKPKEEGKDRFPEFVFSMVVFFFLWLSFSRFSDILVYWKVGTPASIWGGFVSYFLGHVWPTIKVISALVSVAAIAGIIYSNARLKAIIEEEKQMFGSPDTPEAEDAPVENKNEKWERVVAHINSANPSDWRLAVIEADIMLDDLLRASGYHGETIGEMLKAVEKSDFTTIEAAWEAHKVRNRIAHDGAAYDLNEREAKRVIALYESVFREFSII